MNMLKCSVSLLFVVLVEQKKKENIAKMHVGRTPECMNVERPLRNFSSQKNDYLVCDFRNNHFLHESLFARKFL